jgi:hypothetical protein
MSSNGYRNAEDKTIRELSDEVTKSNNRTDQIHAQEAERLVKETSQKISDLISPLVPTPVTSKHRYEGTARGCVRCAYIPEHPIHQV